MRTLVLTTALALSTVLVVVPGSAQAQTSETMQTDNNWNSCGEGFYFDRFEVTTAIYLTGIQINLVPPQGTPLIHSVYWSATAAGPYSQIFEASELHPFGAATMYPAMNIDPGWILAGTAVDMGGTGNTYICQTSQTPAQMNEVFSFGALAEGGSDLSLVTSLPVTYTPTIQPQTYGGFIDTGPPQIWPIADVGGPYVIDEDNSGIQRTVVIDGSASYDPDGTIVTFFHDCDITNGAQSCNNTGTTCGCNYLNDDGTYDGFVRVTDDDGLTTQEPFTVTINNLDPVAAGVCDNGTCAGVEGDTLAFTCTGTDPGWNDVPALSWDLDGVVTDGPTFAPGLGDGNPFAASKTYSDEGTFSAICTAIDNDSGADSDSLTVTILNVAPVLGAVTVPATANEGDTISVSTTATDVGVTDVLSFSWDWADGTTASAGASASHLYADDGAFTVTATVDDADGGSDSGTATVTVANVAPTITAGTCPASAAEAVTASFSLTGSDPGTQDVLGWSLGGTASASLAGTTGTSSGVDWTPTYADAQAGTVTIAVTLSDGDGGSDALNCSVAVSYLDGDGDGMPDSWEALNGLDASVDDAGADPDGDGITNLVEWQSGSDPQASGGPTAPTPTSPVAGAEVAFATPPLAWTNATDPDGDTLTYDLEVYSDSTLSTLVETMNGAAEDSSGTTTAAPANPLTENTAYWWRVRADDGNTTSSWSTAEDFFVNVANDAPGLTTLTFPLASTIVTTLTPTLQWSEVSDVDGDAVSYDVEVYADAALSTLTWSDTALVGLGNGSAEAVTGALVENDWYWWRARSVDEHGLDGGWTAAEQFLVSTADDAPEVVTILWPLDGGQVGELAPVIEVSDGADPEGFAIEYEIELALDAAFTATVWASGAIADSGGASTSWDSADAGAALVEDGEGWVRARSVDVGGLMSGWTTAQFTTNSENNAPTVPTLIAPDGDAFELTDSITFRLQNATDPDGTLRTYDVEVRDDLGAVAWSESGVVEGTKETSTLVLAGDLPYGMNTWTARSADELGLTSEWAAELDFEVVPPKGDDDDSGDDDDATGDDDDATGDDDDSTGDDDDATGDDDDSTPGDDDDSTGGCDCASSVAGGSSGTALLLFGALATIRRRRG